MDIVAGLRDILEVLVSFLRRTILGINVEAIPTVVTMVPIGIIFKRKVKARSDINAPSGIEARRSRRIVREGV